MQSYKPKTIAIIISALLMSSVALIGMHAPSVDAQLAVEQPVSGSLPSGVTVDIAVDTVTFLSFRPTTIGVGQQLLVNMWINPALASNHRFCPNAFRVTLTKPDSTTDVWTLDSEPATGAQWFEYAPDQVGEWTIRVEFLGTYFPAGGYYNGYIVTNSSGTLYGSAYYRPSSTEEQVLTVQQDFVWSWPPAPLPTDYWTRPASLNNREWWPILGNYPGDGYQGGGPIWDALYPDTNPSWSARYGFTPWVQAPNSAHVVWKRQGALGGLTGGPAYIYGSTGNPGQPSVIYEGRCYQSVSKPGVGSVAQCYDLRTGEIYYEIAGGVTPSYLAYTGPAEGALATSSWSVELITISGGRLLKINPSTGAVTGNYSIAPLTGNGGVFHNQIDGYVMGVQDLGVAAGTERYRLINWTTRGTSATLAGRIVSNVTSEWSTGGILDSASLRTAVDLETGLAFATPYIIDPGLGAWWGLYVQAFNLKTGKQIWNTSVANEIPYSGLCTVADHGKFVVLTQKGYFLAFDQHTGQLAWKSEQMTYPWGSTGFGAYAIQSAYGMLFRQSYDGVYAFNWTNGKIVWNYKAQAPAHFESPYITDGVEQYSFNSGGTIADGKMYVANSEHTTTWPITRGWGLHCINITTGEKMWSLNNPMSQGAVADGYLTAANSWDGAMYVFGKGKSATTVTASPKTSSKGDTVLIEGAVLDESPAQPGTPCVSKDSMETQMEYLHLQTPIGGIWHNETISGVPVTLTAIDENGTVLDLGIATTSGYYGTFEKAWTPPAEGTYKIIASFASDDSYGSSAAATAVTVGTATKPIEFPEQITPVDTTMTIIYATIAIITAFAVGIAIAIITLRKR